jgi:hypothetical protein
MGEMGKKLRNQAGGLISFWCPGCDEPHTVNSGWTFNQDLERPTFSPSVLTTSGHYSEGLPGCWCKFNAEHPDSPSSFECSRCHSFVTDGKIQFLSDCSHKLANQTIDLPDWPESYAL